MAFSLAGLAPLAGLASGYQQGMDWRQQQALRGLAIQQAQLANQQAQEQQQVLPTIYAAAQQLGSLQGLQGLPQQPSTPPPTTGDTAIPAQPMSAPAGGVSPNAVQLAQNFVQQGYPPAAAAGLAGAFTGESGPSLNPQAVGDSGAGVGIASWEGPRRAALQRLPASQSFPTQARFAASELAPGGPEARTGQALRNFTGTPQQAAALATTGYLRPNQNAAGYAASMQQRQQAAQQVYQALGGQPTEAQAQPLAQAAGAQVPPEMQGMAQLGQLAQLIERTAPAGTPDNVKAMALFQLHQMLAPDQKQMLALQLQLFKDQMRATQPITPYEQERLAQGAANQGNRGWQFIQQPDGSIVRGNVQTGQIEPAQLPAGAVKLGSSASSTAALPELKYPEKWAGMPNKPPPGVRQDIWDAALFYARTHQMPALGFKPGARDQIMQASDAAYHALGIDPATAPDVAAGYAGERHGEIVLGGRAANLGTAVNEAEAIMPLALDASQKVDRTEYPRLNAVIEAYDRGTGDVGIVRLATFTYALQNVMAQVAARQGASTDAARNRAMETLTEAYSKGQFEAAANAMMDEAKAALTAPAKTQSTLRQTFAPSGAGGGLPQNAGDTAQKIIKLDKDGNVIP